MRFSPLTKLRAPQLRISRYCRQTIFEFQHYIWDEHRRNKEEFDPKDQPKKKNDHFMDCLRYIYNMQPRFIPQEEEEEEIEYTGKYTKHPTVSTGGSSYYKLVENPNGGGNF